MNWKTDPEKQRVARGQILDYFERLNGVLAREGAHQDIVIIGAAALILNGIWEGSYNKYKEDFKESDRDAMEDNLRVLPFMLPQKSEQNPTDPRLFRHKP